MDFLASFVVPWVYIWLREILLLFRFELLRVDFVVVGFVGLINFKAGEKNQFPKQQHLKLQLSTNDTPADY
jgi:hypothetical protein